MLRPFIVDDKTLEFLNQIIAEEKHHIQELHKWVNRDAAEEIRTEDELK
jgi:rubrerythrin